MHMRRLLLAASLLLFAASVRAHPAVSVVFDSHGNVYFSDLKQVWRVVPGGAQAPPPADVRRADRDEAQRDERLEESLEHGPARPVRRGGARSAQRFGTSST